jgi:hypothetical protein
MGSGGAFLAFKADGTSKLTTHIRPVLMSVFYEPFLQFSYGNIHIHGMMRRKMDIFSEMEWLIQRLPTGHTTGLNS